MELENMTNGQLDVNLRRFYAETRKKDGETYGKRPFLVSSTASKDT